MIVYFECVAFREFLDDVSHSSFFYSKSCDNCTSFMGLFYGSGRGVQWVPGAVPGKAIPVARQRVGESRTSELAGL